MKISKHMQQTIAFLACALVVAAPDLALSATTPISEVLCEVVDWMLGPIGAGIATLAVIIIGIGALLGKVSWGMAIIVGLGVAIVFGAPQLVIALTPTGTNC